MCWTGAERARRNAVCTAMGAANENSLRCRSRRHSRSQGSKLLRLVWRCGTALRQNAGCGRTDWPACSERRTNTALLGGEWALCRRPLRSHAAGGRKMSLLRSTAPLSERGTGNRLAGRGACSNACSSTAGSDCSNRVPGVAGGAKGTDCRRQPGPLQGGACGASGGCSAGVICRGRVTLGAVTPTGTPLRNR